MTPGRMPSNNNTTSHTKCECWDNHKNADVTEGSCGCCATHRHTNQTGWEANISLEEQVKRLADFILKNHADKITGGGAIETAIQIIQLLSKEREELREKIEGMKVPKDSFSAAIRLGNRAHNAALDAVLAALTHQKKEV